MKKILVIEDDLITQQFYAMFFKKRGFDSIITDNGDKVFETLASENVGVILMDINLSNTYFNGEK